MQKVGYCAGRRGIEEIALTAILGVKVGQFALVDRDKPTTF